MCAIPALGAAAGAIGGGTTLGGLSTIFSLGSGLVGAFAQIQNARAQAAALEQQARLDGIQAHEETHAAREHLEQGRTQSDRRRRAGAIQKGAQRAALAANGMDVEGELAIGLLDDTSAIIADDAFAIRENARLEAEGRTQQARNAYWRAAGNRTRARNARSAGTFGAIGTILSTGAKVGARFRPYRTMTDF
jgi:hypothetical protein